MLPPTGTKQLTPTYMPAANRASRQIVERMTAIPQSAVAGWLFNLLASYRLLSGQRIETNFSGNAQYVLRKLGYAVLAVKTLQHDTELLLGRKMRCAA